MLRTSSWAVTLIAVLAGSAVCRADDLLGYDPEADPFEQYHEALALAEQQNKLVLVIAGGDWCSWCYVLERFVSSEADVERSLNETFVVMKVYVGFDNYNELFFDQLPPAKGAPHFWVISPQKEVLSSQSTGGFEASKRGYDKAAFLAFIAQWKGQSRIAAAPSATTTS